jgi:hypothetical protein
MRDGINRKELRRNCVVCDNSIKDEHQEKTIKLRLVGSQSFDELRKACERRAPSGSFLMTSSQALTSETNLSFAGRGDSS